MEPSLPSTADSTPRSGSWLRAWILVVTWIRFPYMRWTIKHRGFQYACRKYKIQTQDTPTVTGQVVSPESIRRAKIIEAAVRAAGRYWYGKRKNCLVRSLIACDLIQRRRIPCTLRLGIRHPAEDTQDFAHAWIEINGQPLGESDQAMANTTKLHFQHPRP